MNQKQKVILLFSKRISIKDIYKLTGVKINYIKKIVQDYKKRLSTWKKISFFSKKNFWQILTFIGFFLTFLSVVYILFPTFSHNTLEYLGLEEKEISDLNIQIREDGSKCLALADFNFTGDCRTFEFEIKNWDSNIDAKQLDIDIVPPKNYRILGISRGDDISAEYKVCLKNFLPREKSEKEITSVNNAELIFFNGPLQTQNLEIQSQVLKERDFFSFWVHFVSNDDESNYHSPCVDFSWNIDDDGERDIYWTYGGGDCFAPGYIYPNPIKLLCQDW